MSGTPTNPGPEFSDQETSDQETSDQETSDQETNDEATPGKDEPASKSAVDAQAPGYLNLGRIERYVFRPAFVFLTFLVVVFAIFQAAGRVVTTIAPNFEDELNLALASQRIKVVGLQGGWQGLNPVVRIDSLVIPAGSISNLYAEFDVVESMLRSALIMRFVEVKQAALIAEQTETGWRLLGQQAQAADLDVIDTLWHSDTLNASGRLALVAMTGETQVVDFSLQAGNHSRAHYLSAQVGHAATGSDAQELQLQLWREDGLQYFNRYVLAPQSMAVSLAGGLAIPSVLVNMPELAINVGQVSWYESATAGSGAIQLRTTGLRAPGSEVDLTLDLNLDLRRDGDLFSGITSVLQITAGQKESAPPSTRETRESDRDPDSAIANQITLGPMHVSLDTSDPAPEAGFALAVDEFVAATSVQQSNPLVRVWLEQLDLSALSAFIDSQLEDWEPASRWVRELAVRGFGNNLHAYFDPDDGLGYATSITDLHMQGYKGAPMLLNGQGQVWGYERGIAMQLNATDATVQFPDLYHHAWALDEIQGLIKAWFEPGYFGLRGSHLRARMGRTQIAGGFAVTRPDPVYEQRVSLQLSVDEVEMARGLTFVPFKIPPELASWLDTGPQSGELLDAQFAYHGQVRTRPDELARRVELLTSIRDASLYYDARWPLVESVSGRIHAAGPEVRVQLDSARSLGIALADTAVILRDNSRYADVTMSTSGDGARYLEFVRNSPLAQDLNFIKPDWTSAGELSIDGTLLVPIKREVAPPLAVNFAYSFADADLTMPDYRVTLSNMRGTGTYALPHHITGDLEATLFDAPATIQAESSDDWLRFAIAGQARPQDIYRMIKFDGSFPVAGTLAFDSVLSIAMRKSRISNMSVTTNLTGLQVKLPGQFGKQALVAAPSEFDIQFLPRYQSLRWRSMGTQGWLHYGTQVERGAIGIASDPPMTAQDQRAILISGTMPLLKLSNWVSQQGDVSVSLPLDWTIRDLHIGEFYIDELGFTDVKLNGTQRDATVEFQFDAPDVRGQLRMSDKAVMDLDLAYLRLPRTEVAVDDPLERPAADPLSVDIGYSLPAAKINIAQLNLGDTPFGSWQFEIQPQLRAENDAINFANFNASVNGVHINNGAVRWDLKRNIAGFVGNIALDDLAETLPKWDYAPSLQTTQASMFIDAQWAGSPVNVSLYGLEGKLDFLAEDGQFMEVESGNSGLRILSLLNFSNITRRISFDFSDVTSEGITFDKIQASVKLNRGRLDIMDRMIVNSSSSNFEVGGSVDLVSGQLNNEMIVTLPVSNSLPWYGVYLALANPLAGLGVLVGERVLRKPIRQMSSAKFSVKGTLDEPEVNFVSLFDRSLASGTASGGNVELETPAVKKQVLENQRLDEPVNPSGR